MGSSTTGVPSPAEITTLPDGQIVTSQAGVLVWGTNTVTVPIGQSNPMTVTTDGETFTFGPQPAQTPGVSTETLPDGATVTSSSGLLVWGTNTLTVPTGLNAPVTTTADGETFTFQPTGLPISTGAASGLTETLPDGVVVTSSAGILEWSTNTLTVPTGLSDPVTTTAFGEIFTFIPTGLPVSTGNAPGLTETLPDGVVVTSSSGFLIWGTNKIPVPTSLTTNEVITTDGETFTFFPSSNTRTLTSTTTTTGALVTFTT